jgi:carboxylesterase type B
LLGDSAFEPWAAEANKVISNVASFASDAFNAGNEDCLYLDVYVPGKAVRDPKAKLPVLNWIYGGAVSCLGTNLQFRVLTIYSLVSFNIMMFF